MFLSWLFKLAVFCAVIAALATGLSGVARDVLQALGMYCFICLMMDGPASFLVPVLGFDIIPTFDPPWLATSMADFWGRRWNITTSHMLRATVYDPIVEGRFVKAKPGSARRAGYASTKLRRGAALWATFLVSGIVHETIFWLVNPSGKVTWKWLAYFTIQAGVALHCMCAHRNNGTGVAWKRCGRHCIHGVC